MIPRILTKNIDSLVIGGNLDALEFAYHNGIPIFYDTLQTPFAGELTKNEICKRDIFFTYSQLLSLAGLNYSSYNITSYSLEDKKLKGFGKLPWTLEINYDTLYDMRKLNIEDGMFKVVDYIDVRSAGYHQIKTIKTKHKFVNEIIFYPSQRMNASKKYSSETHDYAKIAKDLMVISYLTSEQLENDEYSSMYSRVITKQLMKEHGIRGRIRKRLDDGRVQTHSISLVFNRREVYHIEQNARSYYYNNTKHKYLERLSQYLYDKKWRKNYNKYL